MLHDLQSLFKEEVDALNIAKKVCEGSKSKGNISVEDFKRIISSYEHSLRSMMKITRISDCQQIYLQEIQEELQKEIEERKKVEEKLKYYAYTDHMTGVSNRRVGFRVIEEELKKCLKEHSYFSVCFIDIDKLKCVNDKYGHTEGDYLINAIVKFIKEFIKELHYISRMGGDEFMIIFPKRRYQDAQETMNKVLKRIEEFNEKKLKSYNISFSYGIKEINENTIINNVDEIIKIADELMYKNKISKKSK
jgi:diguanylate cyclase (GGDEF) domain